MLLSLLLACAAPEEADPLAYDSTRTGRAGADGPWGVHRVSRADTDPPVDRFFPVGEGGAEAEVGAQAVTIVLIQGGGVVPDRYWWLAQHLGSRGATVLVPHHGLDLAFFDQTAGERALAAAVEAGEVDPDAPLAFVGHSLGGVVSSYAWAGDDTITGLALLASYPADDAAVEGRGEGTVVSILGGDDAKVSRTEAEAGVERFGAPHAFVTVPGMNHYDWTDDATEGELASDGTPSEPQADTRRSAQGALDGWVDACLTASLPSWTEYAEAHPDTVVGSPCDVEPTAE